MPNFCCYSPSSGLSQITVHSTCSHDLNRDLQKAPTTWSRRDLGSEVEICGHAKKTPFVGQRTSIMESKTASVPRSSWDRPSVAKDQGEPSSSPSISPCGVVWCFWGSDLGSVGARKKTNTRGGRWWNGLRNLRKTHHLPCPSPTKAFEGTCFGEVVHMESFSRHHVIYRT